MLLDLQPCTVLQSELDLKWNEAPDKSKTAGLMSAMDALNQRYGRGTMTMASAGLGWDRRTWSMKQARRSPGYTTSWADMPVARA
jgi:DNA polymerase V